MFIESLNFGGATMLTRKHLLQKKVLLKKVLPLAVSVLSVTAFAQQTLEETRVGAEDDDAELSGVIVIDDTRIDAEMIKDIKDTVRYIPGVQVNDSGNRFGSNGFNIRGMEGDAVAINIDGLRQGEVVDPLSFSRYGMFSANRNGNEIQSMKTVEIVKGANSVLAGSGALGGAVMYVTKDPEDYLRSGDDAFASELEAGYDSRNEEMMLSGAIANRFGNLTTLVQYTLRDGGETQAHSDGDDISGNARSQADEFDIEKTNLLVKLAYQLTEDQRVGLVFEDYQNEANGNPLSRDSGTYFDFDTFDEENRDRIGVFYQWNSGNALFDTLNFTWDQQEIYKAGLTAFAFQPGGPYLRQEDRDKTEESQEIAIDFDKSFATGRVDHQVVYGIETINREIEITLFDIRYNGLSTDSGIRAGYPQRDPSWIPPTESDVLTAYISDRLSLTENLELSVGLRYEDTQYSPTTDETFTNPFGVVGDAEFSAAAYNIALGYTFAPGHKIIASVGTAYKAPTTMQLYYGSDSMQQHVDAELVVNGPGDVTYQPTGLVAEDWNSVTNPDLDAEEGINYELSYRWSGAKGYVEVTGFISDYDNFIANLSHFRPLDETINSATRITPFNMPGTTCPNPPAPVGEECWAVEQITADEYFVPTNVGQATVKGYEIDTGFQLSDTVNLTFSYAHADGEFGNTVVALSEDGSEPDSVLFAKGDPMPSVAPDSANLSLGYSNNTWGINGTATWNDGQEERFESILFYTDSSTVFDLIGHYRVSDAFTARLSITNLFDKKYFNWHRVSRVREGDGGFFGGVDFDVTTGASEGINRFSEPGRSYALSLAYQF